LIAMLLPALQKAKESANRVACISNQRQIYMAAVMFAGDHNDHLPPGTSWQTGSYAVTYPITDLANIPSAQQSITSSTFSWARDFVEIYLRVRLVETYRDGVAIDQTFRPRGATFADTNNVFFCPSTSYDINQRRGEAGASFGRPDTQIDFLLPGLSPTTNTALDPRHTGYSVLRKRIHWKKRSDGFDVPFSFDSAGEDRISISSTLPFVAHTPHSRGRSDQAKGINVINNDGSGVWIPNQQCTRFVSWPFFSNDIQLLPPGTRIPVFTSSDPSVPVMNLVRNGVSVQEPLSMFGTAIRVVGTYP